MSEITLIVHIKAKAGHEEALERALRAAVPPTHEEAGCLRFALHRASEGHGKFLLVERWTSQAALDAHLKKPYLTKLLAELKDLAETSEARPYQLISEGDARKLL